MTCHKNRPPSSSPYSSWCIGSCCWSNSGRTSVYILSKHEQSWKTSLPGVDQSRVEEALRGHDRVEVEVSESLDEGVVRGDEVVDEVPVEGDPVGAPDPLEAEGEVPVPHHVHPVLAVVENFPVWSDQRNVKSLSGWSDWLTDYWQTGNGPFGVIKLSKPETFSLSTLLLIPCPLWNFTMCFPAMARKFLP